MLKTNGIVSGYGKVMILNDVSISMVKGEIVTIIGRNGVGKSTLMKTLIGLNKVSQGKIEFDGSDVTELSAYERAKIGLAYVPQGHGVFPHLSVEENLKIGGLINSDIKHSNLDIAYEYFPRLFERKKQMAGTMSGGERAMLSIGRVLVGKPKIILLDEPSEGIQPNVVMQIGEIIRSISKELGLTVLLVEQHMRLIQAVSERGYVIDNGHIIASLTNSDFQDQQILSNYLTV